MIFFALQGWNKRIGILHTNTHNHFIPHYQKAKKKKTKTTTRSKSKILLASERWHKYNTNPHTYITQIHTKHTIYLNARLIKKNTKICVVFLVTWETISLSFIPKFNAKIAKYSMKKLHFFSLVLNHDEKGKTNDTIFTFLDTVRQKMQTKQCFLH